MPYAIVKIFMSTWFVLDGANHTSTSGPQGRSWLVEFPKNIRMFPAMNGCEFSVSTPTFRFLCFSFPTSTSVRSRNRMSVVLLIDTLATIMVRSIFSVICTYMYRMGSLICMDEGFQKEMGNLRSAYRPRRTGRLNISSGVWPVLPRISINTIPRLSISNPPTTVPTSYA